MHPVTHGTKLTLVFNLIWTNAEAVELPADLPSYFTALLEAKNALTPWMVENDASSQDLNLNEPSQTESKMLNPSPNIAADQDSDSDVSTHSSESDFSSNDYHLPWERSWRSIEDDNSGDGYQSLKNLTPNQEDVLFFVLQERYKEENLTFNRLRGEDRDLVHLLQRLHYIELHLAHVTMRNTQKHLAFDNCRDRTCADCDEDAEDEVSVKISRWIDSDNCIKHLSLALDWEKQQCVGPHRSLLAFKKMEADKHKRSKLECKAILLDDFYHHSILVVWPKHQTIRMNCYFNFHPLLDSIENSINSAQPNNRKDVLLKATQDLRKIVSCCRKEPTKVWKASLDKNNEVTLRLLRVCTVLRAREEGIALLHLLGSDLMNKSFDGIQNERIAKAIADFECQVTGWDDCAYLIKRIISPGRIARQIVPVTKLVQYLQDVDCATGVDCIENWISSILTDGHLPMVKRRRDVRVAELFHFLLEIHKSNSNESMEKYPFILNLMHHLCELIVSLLSCELTIMPSREKIIEAIKVFIRVGDQKLTRSLLQKLCKKQLSDSNPYRLHDSKYDFLNNLVSASEVWQGLDSDSKGIIVKACLTLAETWFVFLSQELDLNRNKNPYDTLQKRILKCVQIFFLAEKHRNECNVNEECVKFDKANDAFSQLLAKSSPVYLMHFVLELYKSERKADVSIKEFPECFSLYLKMCERFFSAGFISSVKNKKDAVKIVRCLLWLDNSQIWRCFSQNVVSLSLPSTQTHEQFIEIFTKNSDLLQAVSASSLAFAAFMSILDYKVGQLSSIEEPSEWQQPDAQFPFYPEVETFLRSTQEKMTCTQFSNIAKARRFAQFLETNGPSMGFSVKVTSSGNRKSARCDISKNPKYNNFLMNAFQVKKSQLDLLINLRHSLGQERAKRLFDKTSKK